VTKGFKKHKAILPLESPRETLCNKSPIAYKVLRKKKILSKRTKRFPKTKSPKVHQQKP